MYRKNVYGVRGMAENKGREGTVIIESRRRIVLRGVKEVLSFDDVGATLMTECGELCIEGSGIRLSELTGIGDGNGEVSITGKIDALFYRADAAEKKRGIRSRLLGR